MQADEPDEFEVAESIGNSVGNQQAASLTQPPIASQCTEYHHVMQASNLEGSYSLF